MKKPLSAEMCRRLRLRGLITGPEDDYQTEELRDIMLRIWSAYQDQAKADNELAELAGPGIDETD